MSKQLNNDMLTDAIGKIDSDYLEDYALMDARLKAKRPRQKRYIRALLISAACLVLVGALLLGSLPVGYLIFHEPINNVITETLDRVIFQSDSDDTQGNDYAAWVDWRVTKVLFDSLGAGTDHSVIESMKQGSGGIVGDLGQDFGAYLDKMYRYYMKQSETIGVLEDDVTQDGEEVTISRPMIDPSVPEIASIHGVVLNLHFNDQTGQYEYWITGMNGTWAEIYIPGEYKGVPVTTIAEGAFKGHKQLKSVRIEDSITRIEAGAFDKCISLQSVEFPVELESIGERAFGGCTLLESVEIGSTKPVEIGKEAFVDCSALQRISIPDSPVSIGDYAFAYCSGLEEIEMNALTYIGYSAFEKCVQLKKVSLPRSLTEIGSLAFASCESLQKVVMPQDCALKTIGVSAFANCFALESIDLPVGLLTIESDAFYYCIALERIVIPCTVEMIGSGAFFECSALQSVIMEDGNEDRFLIISGQAFMNCKNLSEIRLSNTVRIIESEAFYGIWGATELTLPENLESINRTAIYYWPNLQVIEITNPNTLYESNAIFSCPNLTEIIFCGTKESWHAVEKGFSLKQGTVIHCEDGDLVIDELQNVE